MRHIIRLNDIINKHNINAILYSILGVMVIESFTNLRNLSMNSYGFSHSIPLFDFYFEGLLTLFLGIVLIKTLKNNILKPGFLVYFIVVKVMMGIRIYPVSMINGFISGEINNYPRLFNFSIISYIEDYFEMKELLGTAPIHFLGNFLLFAPLGILLVFEFTKSIKKSLILGFVIIFSFEFSQLLSTLGSIGAAHIELRTFDVVDIITNYTGFLIVYLITYYSWRYIKHVFNS
jgi:glycopeptide antibiotics resistance protein